MGPASPSAGHLPPQLNPPEVPVDTHISFTRPETRDTITRMSVPDTINPMKQIHRLRALGYSIVNVNPPLPTNIKN